jgi:hypothetical protein
MGWRKLKNGDLLRTAEENGFNIFVTGDQTIASEQNLAGRRLTILALSANNWPIIKDYVAEILAAINSAAPGSFQTSIAVRSREKNSLTSEERRFPAFASFL